MPLPTLPLIGSHRMSPFPGTSLHSVPVAGRPPITPGGDCPGSLLRLVSALFRKYDDTQLSSLSFGGGGGTILVVDDTPASRELVVDLLTASGYVVREAEHGEGLLQRVKRERPALIILDLQLPGMDGFTLARQLKADPDTRGILVLAVIAYALPEDQAQALAAGCDGYLGKPVNIRELTETVAHMLRCNPPSPPGRAASA